MNGSQSRSFVAVDGGAKSQVSNLWAAGFVGCARSCAMSSTLWSRAAHRP
ncbi:MAG: hypothetical protein ACC726_04245 [Chloroflexota bacterium]